VTTLVPSGVTATIVDETHNKYSDDRPFFTNKPPDGVTSFRYEVPSPASPASTERRFLHAIVVGALGATPATPVRITGDQAVGAAIEGEAYVFSDAGPSERATALSYVAPLVATHHIVSDLAPGAAYTASAAPSGAGCKVSLAPGTGKTASRAGVLTLDLSGCALR
jgi:hypothetical protein